MEEGSGWFVLLWLSGDPASPLPSPRGAPRLAVLDLCGSGCGGRGPGFWGRSGGGCWVRLRFVCLCLPVSLIPSLLSALCPCISTRRHIRLNIQPGAFSSLPFSCSLWEMLCARETEPSQSGALGRINSRAWGPGFWELEGLGAPEVSTCWTLARPPTGRRQDAQLGMGPPGVADVPAPLWAEVLGSTRAGQGCVKDRLAGPIQGEGWWWWMVSMVILSPFLLASPPVS